MLIDRMFQDEIVLGVVVNSRRFEKLLVVVLSFHFTAQAEQ